MTALRPYPDHNQIPSKPYRISAHPTSSKNTEPNRISPAGGFGILGFLTTEGEERWDLSVVVITDNLQIIY